MTESPALLFGRLVAFVAGLAVLITAAVMSLGVALAAPVGAWVINRVQRKRGRAFGAWESWLGAVSATLIATVIVSGGVAARVRGDTWSVIRHAADSASAEAATKPPPAWVRRMSPSASQTAVRSPRQSSTVTLVMMVWGIAITLGVMSLFVGTVGWAGTLLLVFSGTGHWFRAPPQIQLDPDAI